MNQTNQTKRIEAYSIADFVKQIQEAVLEGYKINLEDNEKYPLQIGVGFYCTLDKVAMKNILVQESMKNIQNGVEAGTPIIEAIPAGATSQDTTPAKRGRQPKV